MAIHLHFSNLKPNKTRAKSHNLDHWIFKSILLLRSQPAYCLVITKKQLALLGKPFVGIMEGGLTTSIELHITVYGNVVILNINITWVIFVSSLKTVSPVY